MPFFAEFLDERSFFRLELRRASLFSQGNLFFTTAISALRCSSFILLSFLGWKRQWLRRHTINTEVFNNSYCADSNEPLICAWKTTLTLIYILPLQLESCVQLLLASHNLSGMSYFGGLGRNILCNVSLSQGNKFLRPSAACLIPCFNAGRIQGNVSVSILRL